jgi:predicted MFS family arabinose efflux permease
VVKGFKTIFTDNTRALYVLAIMVIFGVATGLFMGTLNNYLHEVLAIGKAERGWVEFPRELPGLLLIVLLSLFYRLCETTILRIAMLISLAGLAGISFLGESMVPAIIMIVLWSTGEHLFMPVRSSISVHLAREGKEGLALGSVRSVGNLGQVIGYGLVAALFLVLSRLWSDNTPFQNFRIVFLVAALIMLAGLAVSLKLKPAGNKIKRKRMYMDRKYWRYYLLEVFFGARKQVFLTFAPFVLILHYNARTQLLATLYFSANLAIIFIGPALGKLVDRIGYRTVIIADALILVVLCILYGFTHNVLEPSAAFIVICAVFILDSILFVAGMARTMYVKSISSSREETTATLSTGLSINHLISILIAIGGGVLWERLGIETLFSVAALLGIGSFVFSLTLPAKKPTAE